MLQYYMWYTFTPKRVILTNPEPYFTPLHLTL